MCVVLLGAGAEVNAQTNPQGYAPLHSAAFAAHVAAIEVLLAHGADRGLVNYRGERPADTARRTGQTTALIRLEAKDTSQERESMLCPPADSRRKRRSSRIPR